MKTKKGTVLANVAGVDSELRPPCRVLHHRRRRLPVNLQRRSSTTGVVPQRDYTRTVQSMFLPGHEPGEQRKKDGFGSRLQQRDGLPYVENSNPGIDSKQGESTSGKEKEEDEMCCCIGKRGVHPSLYRPRGVPSSSPPPCGTKLPRGGGGAPA